MNLSRVSAKTAQILENFPILGATGIYVGLKCFAKGIDYFQGSEAFETVLDAAAPIGAGAYIIPRIDRSLRNHTTMDNILTTATATFMGYDLVRTLMHSNWSNPVIDSAKNSLEHASNSTNIEPAIFGCLIGGGFSLLLSYIRNRPRTPTATP